MFIRLIAALLITAAFALPVTTHAAEAPVLTIINWEEFLAPQVIQAFEKREGVKIREIHFSTVEESLQLARTNAGKADLIVGGKVVTEQLKRANLLQKLNRAKLNNVKASLAQFEVNPDYVVPYVWGYTGMAWRTDALKEPVDSYAKLLAVARKNPGKVILTDDGMEFAHIVLMMYGSAPFNHDDLSALKAALAKYDAEGRKLFRIQPSEYSAQWPLASGAAVAGVVYNGDIQFHRDNSNAPLTYANPKEGCFFWQENFMLMAKAPQPDLAHRFLNYISEGKVAARNAEAVNYASGNPMAAQFYSKAFLDNPYIRPRLEGTAGCRVNKPLSPATQQFLDKLKPYGVSD